MDPEYGQSMLLKFFVLSIFQSVIDCQYFSNTLEDNGGNFRYGNVRWARKLGNTVEFTIGNVPIFINISTVRFLVVIKHIADESYCFDSESAWRRDYGSAYWKGNGPDGLAITGESIV